MNKSWIGIDEDQGNIIEAEFDKDKRNQFAYQQHECFTQF